MAKAIHTRFIPATDTKPARVKAMVHLTWGNVLTVTISEDPHDRPHEAAALALRDKYWPDLPMVECGSTLDGRGYVYSVGFTSI